MLWEMREGGKSRLSQCCPVECSVMPEVFYIRSVHRGSHELQVAPEQMKCGSCGQGTRTGEFRI